MAKKSYIIPVGDLTLDDRQAMRRQADDDLLAAAIRVRIRDDDRDLLVRDTLPNTDLGVGIGGPAVGAGTAEDWLDQIAGVVGTEHQLVSAALAIDRCIGFYGLGDENAPPLNSRVRLTLGAASSEIRGVFQLEALYSRLEAAGYFSETVVFVRQETCRIMVMPRIAYAALVARMHFLARTVEPIGAVVSARAI